MTEMICVYITTSSKEEADRIASVLVEQRLAACVQVDGPIESTYRWQGKTETATEWRCTAKTLDSHRTQIESKIRELHSYDVPEIIAIKVSHVGQDYLDWVREQTS